MLQRGLAILLSVSMLAGGISDTAYAMNPQVEMETGGSAQNVSGTEELSEPSAEEETGDQEDNTTESGTPNEGNGTTEEGAGSEGEATGSEDGSAEDGNGTSQDIVDDDNSTSDDETNGSEEDAPDHKDGGDSDTTGDEADDDNSTSEDPVGSEDADSAPEDDDPDDAGNDNDTPIDDDRTDPDSEVPVDEDDGEDEADAADTDTLSENNLSVFSTEEEDLMLTVDAPQEVTLEAAEEQWLSFMAPEEGTYKFYSTSEDNTYLSKQIYLYHEKADSQYDDYFAQDYGSGQDGNFNITYQMQAGETVYLSVLFGDYSASGTFTVHAEQVFVPELTVTQNSEGNYTLQSDDYRLNLVLTPSYSMVKAAVELRQADGSALTGYNSYRIYYDYSYDSKWGGTGSGSEREYLYSSSDYKAESDISGLAAGGKLLITELQVRDSSNNILAMLGTDGQEITVNTKVTDKLGILAEVSAYDANISIRPEMITDKNGCIRYRKKEADEWTYYKDTIFYYSTGKIELEAEPDTDYVIELTGTDLETVYDTAEVRTKAFAAADITAEVTNITSSGAAIKINIGSYTGSNQYIRARVSYVDSMGDTQGDQSTIYTSNITNGITLSLTNLKAATEYNLEVELDDTDDYEMKYVAYRTKVSFTTLASAITEGQIDVTVTPDAEDGTKAVLKTALQGVSEGSYLYTARYRVAGSKDWTESNYVSGTLYASNSYIDEKNLTSLMGNTEYEVLVMVDGITRTASFTTAAAAVAATVEVKPLMRGVEVTAALTGASSGEYTIEACCYDLEQRRWIQNSPIDYESKRLTADNNWQTTAVFYTNTIRPNAGNDWKIIVSKGYNDIVYEKYMALEAVRQEISLTAEDVSCTTARIRGVLADKDESIQNAAASTYYRVMGAAQWTKGNSCSYGNDNGGMVYLSDLQEDTEYEVKLVLSRYPDDTLAQTTFRTLKDTRSLSVSVDNCRYTSAQINWTFGSGANVLDNSSYICIHYRKKGDSVWEFVDYEWVRTTTAGKESLTGLESGTVYEVLAELKDTSNVTAGAGVVRHVTAEFTTAAVDHVLQAKPVAEETKSTSAVFDVQLTKPTGTLEHRAKATVTLTPADGSDIRSKEVYLGKDNQYQAKLMINNLLPETKYAVSAELYESESNKWAFLKQYDLGEVTTAATGALSSLTISETELLLNKGMSKQLTITAQPPEAAAGLIWTSSDSTVVTVSEDGNVTAHKAGEADITVTAAGAAADGQEKVSAVCHVTVRDYAIRVKNTDESYDNIPGILSKAQKRTLVAYENTAGAELAGVTWTSSNPHTARISGEGLLEPQNYGKTYITAKMADGITLKTEAIIVINEIQGFSITRPETDRADYAAIRTAEAVYQVAAGETYRVGCVLSPAYTDTYSSSIGMAGSRFNWSSDNAAVSVGALADSDLTEIRIPQTVSGQVNITAVMKDAEYTDKSFSITLDVLKKPEVEVLPDTYTWLDYSNMLKSAALPESWQWKEQDTLFYETGAKVFTARYEQAGYYPYETSVTVHAERIGSTLSVRQTGTDGNDSAANYSAGKKAYIVKKGMPLKVKAGVRSESAPALLYEQAAFVPAAKDAAKVSVSAPDADGYYSVTASAKGTYTVSAAVALKKAAFEKQGSKYVLKAGGKIKDTTISLRFMAADSAPVQKINFAVAVDSPEKVTITEEGTIEYEIRASNASSKQNERVIYLDVTAVDTDGSPVENPGIDYKVSDTAVVKPKKVGTDRLVLTIPKGADGLAKITATAKDGLGQSEQLAVRVKDYTPRVTAYKINVNENYTYSTQIAQVVLPYEKDGNDRIEKVSLVETNGKDGTDTVAGLSVRSSAAAGSYKHNIYLNIADKAQIKQRGNLKYYLAIQTTGYGGLVFVPVQIKLETGIPAVTLKQSGKVNVFYTDTTHLTGYDAVSMGLVDVTSAATVESVRWVAGDGSASAANTEFVIENDYSSTWKNGKNTKKYMIQQHRPILDSSKKPSNAAAVGTLYVRLSGYTEEVSKPFTIQTVYKKPKLKVADYKVCPVLGEETDHQYIYTNAAKTGNSMLRGNASVWRGYSDVLCNDEDVEILSGSNVNIRYTGTKDKKTQFTLYSDYWYEPLTVLVKIKAAKSKVKLSTAAVTLNTVYPTETTQTVAAAWICNAATGTYVNVSDVGIAGANKQAQDMLDQSLINIDSMNARLSVSVNYAKAMGNAQFKPGTYKYKLTPYYEDTALNTVTLTVKIIGKEAAVKVKTKGSIDLLKLNWSGTDYDSNYSPVVTVTPTFQNLDSSYQVTDAQLCGAYKDCFKIVYLNYKGTIEILPSSIGRLKAGKSYKLSVMYTVRDAYGEGGETIAVTSNTFTIKPKQSVPKVTSSAKQLTLYASAQGNDKGETMSLYVPHDSKKGYYVIESASGYLDVNKDGRPDLCVTTVSTYASSGRATIRAYVLDADAVKAAAKGTAYKIPVTVQCKGNDGVSKNASTTVSVLVKK